MRIDEIRERAEKATKGPWESPLKDLRAVEFGKVDFYFDHSFEAYPPLGEAGPIFVAASREDADFLTHSREDIPYLLKELDAANQRIKELEGKLAFEEEDHDACEAKIKKECDERIKQLEGLLGEAAEEIKLKIEDGCGCPLCTRCSNWLSRAGKEANNDR